MIILYIYSTCWHMKSMFYEHQHLGWGPDLSSQAL
jgi:hypothetical protein